MKWKQNAGPEDWEIRKRIIFAVWPHKTTDGYRVWLEPVTSNEYYDPRGRTWRRETYTAIHTSTNGIKY